MKNLHYSGSFKNRNNKRPSNNTIPYHHNLKHSLVVKSNILITGFILPSAARFSIDLCSHHFDKLRIKRNKQIALHFNPRFDENCVVRNSFLNGVWGAEEVHAAKKNPFRRGQMFIMEIFVLKNEYLISVNGVHFCRFAHRISPSNVDSIDICGDIQLLQVELSGREMYPSTESTLLVEDTSHDKLATPFKYRLPPSGLHIGSQIEIDGRVKLLPFGFQIRLQCGPQVFPHPDVPYQLSALWLQEKVKVTVNYWFHKDGHWGPETVCSNVFKPNGDFVIRITVVRFGFLTDVGHSKFPMLKHTVEISTINTIYIKGDVAINNIRTS